MIVLLCYEDPTVCCCVGLLVRPGLSVVPATEARAWLLAQQEWQPAHHHSELAVTDLPVTVLVNSLDHRLYLGEFDFGRKVLEDKLEFVGRNAALLILAEYSETFLKNSSSQEGNKISPYLVLDLQVHL